MHTQIHVHESDLFPYQPISPIWMIMYIFSSLCFFIKLNRLIKSNDSCKNTIKNNWLKENIFLSFIHAIICSMLIIIGILRAPEMLEDPLSHSNHFNYALIAFSLGYFLYDFFDCMQNSISSLPAILAHHVIVITFLTYVLYYTRIIGYAVYGLSIEINSVFLHARRLVRWYSPIISSNDYHNRIKTFIEIGNYITFILFRFGIVIIGLRALYIERHRLHPIVHLFLVMISLAIGLLNFVLFYRLSKKYFFNKSTLIFEKQS